MSKPTKIAAKVAPDGALRVATVEPPGCIQVLSDAALWLVGYVAVFGVGVIVGMMLG